MVDRKPTKRSKVKAKTVLPLADLEQSQTAVLHSLGAASSEESYDHAIDEFIAWYRSEPALAFSQPSSFVTDSVSNRGFELLPRSTFRLAAVRRLAYETFSPGLS